MIRFIISFLLFLQVTQATSFTYPDFTQCYNKNVQSFVYFGDTRAVAVSKYLAVAYSKTTPKVDFIKFDPFLNLYLFKSTKALTPVKFKSTHLLQLGEWIAGMDDSSVYIGNFSKSGDLLDTLYVNNIAMEENSIVSCLCCEVYGLSVENGSFIGSEYIQRFIKEKDVYYGDIGAKFEKAGKDFFVKSIDPSFSNVALHVGDKILKINGKTIISLKQLTQTILFSKPQSKLNIEFLREKVIMQITAKVESKDNTSENSDSFFGKKGIFFNKDMKVKMLGKDGVGESSGLKVGDKLMQINGMEIMNEEDLKLSLSKVKDKSLQLLFDRNDFQFFIKLPL